MILVFGRTGQVARELARRADDARFLGRDEADLADPPACAARIAELAPDAVINAAAWTDVDGAERQEEAAFRINAEAPAAMARACAERAIPFVQLSSDYVFDGSGDMPWTPASATAPLSAYGRSKLGGETAVRAAGGRHAILRTSWVFSAHGRNFVRTMLRLGRERDRLDVVADQIGGPTPAAAVAAASLSIVRRLAVDPSAGGIHHFAGTPDVSWADFARAIIARAGLACRIADIASADYPTAAPRPANSRLDCRDLARLGLKRPDWRPALDDVLAELGAHA